MVSKISKHQKMYADIMRDIDRNERSTQLIVGEKRSRNVVCSNANISLSGQSLTSTIHTNSNWHCAGWNN